MSWLRIPFVLPLLAGCLEPVPEQVRCAGDWSVHDPSDLERLEEVGCTSIEGDLSLGAPDGGALPEVLRLPTVTEVGHWVRIGLPPEDLDAATLRGERDLGYRVGTLELPSLRTADTLSLQPVGTVRLPSLTEVGTVWLPAGRVDLPSLVQADFVYGDVVSVPRLASVWRLRAERLDEAARLETAVELQVGGVRGGLPALEDVGLLEVVGEAVDPVLSLPALAVADRIDIGDTTALERLELDSGATVGTLAVTGNADLHTLVLALEVEVLELADNPALSAVVLDGPVRIDTLLIDVDVPQGPAGLEALMARAATVCVAGEGCRPGQ